MATLPSSSIRHSSAVSPMRSITSSVVSTMLLLLLPPSSRYSRAAYSMYFAQPSSEMENTWLHASPSRLHAASSNRSPAMHPLRLFTTREGRLPLNIATDSSNHCFTAAVFSVSAVSSRARPSDIRSSRLPLILAKAALAVWSFKSRLLKSSSMPRSRMADSSGDSSPATTSGASSV